MSDALVRTKRVTLSAAVFVLVCFFLPWVEVSCAGLKDSESGFDLARGGERALWLVPLLMLAVILLGLVRIWNVRPTIFALVSMASGIVSTFLMNRERVDTERTSGLAHVTGWFWLGLASSVVVAVSALMYYLKRPKAS